ncbi:MAG: hypothetical protein ACE5Z5_10060 [Candidatus Bathyarchaeia archaeon]
MSVFKVVLERKIPIRIDFVGEDVEKFEVVKRWMGLKQNTEVVRALIAEKYREILTTIPSEDRKEPEKVECGSKGPAPTGGPDSSKRPSIHR